jgi:tRNA-2-methylthio-N6-dimethylallyladenosine synthase
MSGRYFIKTFGCQMNEYDSSRMGDVLAAAHGLEPAPDEQSADILLMNTCSVRDKAEDKVYSLLGTWRLLKAQRPGVIIGVGGCVASQEGDAITARAPYVDLVFGPQTIHRLPQLLADLRRTGRPQIDISFPEIEKFDQLPAQRATGAAAFVSIMEGCSKFCSYCVVPYTRGEEVSRPAASVLEEVRGLLAQGVVTRQRLAPRGALGGELAAVGDVVAVRRAVAGVSHGRRAPRFSWVPTPNGSGGWCQQSGRCASGRVRPGPGRPTSRRRAG